MFAKKYQTALQNCIAIIVLFSMLLSSVQPVFAQDATPETPTPTETGQVPTEEVITEVPTVEPTASPTETGQVPTEEATENPTEEITETPTEVPTEVLIPTEVVTETPVVDITPPTGTITTPVAGTVNASPLQIRVDAIDTESGVAKVEFYVSTTIPAVDWALIGAVMTAPYEYAWDWSSFADGDVLLSATVYDLAGNSTMVSNPVQVTLEHTLSAQSFTNDNMADATEIVMGTEYIQDTVGNTLELGEPLDYCNDDSSGSVWYKFTPSASGIFTFNTDGTDYNHAVSIFKASDQSLATCVREPSGIDGHTPFSYYAEAGVEYLVAISSFDTVGGTLVFQVDPYSCSATDLCVTVRGGNKWAEKFLTVKLVDDENNWVGEIGNPDNGVFVFDGIPEGDYQVIAAGYGLLSFNENVHVPGVFTVAGDELPRYEINLKDKNGSSAVVDELIISHGKNAFATTTYWSDEIGHGWFYANPGTYSMQLRSDNANSVIVDDSFTLDGVGGTIELDMSAMPTEDFTVTLDEVVGEVFYEQTFNDTYAQVWLPFNDGGTVTVALPENYGFDPTLVVMDLPYRSNFSIGGFHIFTGSDDITTTFGGDLTMEIGINSPAYTQFTRNYRLGGTGYLSSFVHDEYGNYLIYTENNWIETPIVYEVKNTNNIVIPGSLYEGRTDVWANYEFPIAEYTGTWHASATYDSGAWQGLVTGTRDFTVLEELVIPNDNMVDATEIVMGTEYTQETSGNTLEVEEPLAYCNDDSSGSVWYKFTPTTSGIFTFNTDGTDYNHAVSIFKASDLSLATCVREPNEIGEDQTPFAYYAEAGVEYLVAISSFDPVGGMLTFKAESVTCPAGALCVTVRNGTTWAEKWMEIKLLDDDNNWAAGKWGADNGYFVFEDVPAGTYKMVAAGYGLLYFDDTVSIPGIYTVAGEELPRYDIDLRDKNGNPTECNELTLGIGNEYYGISSYWSDEIGRGWLYATPGTYSIQVSSNSSQTMISQVNFELPAGGGALTLNAGAYDFEEFTFHLDDIPFGTSYMQNLPNTYFWGNWIPVEDGDTVTVVQPDQFVTKVQLVANKDEEGQQNRLVFEKWDYDHIFSGSNDEDLTFGGDLSLDVEFYNPIDNWYEGPYRLGGTGYLAGALTDEYGNRLVYTEKQYNSQAFTFSVKDTANAAIPGDYALEWPDVWNKYEFPIPTTKAAGTWHATASIDTGDWQGIVTTTENFEVKAAIANDNIANARTITLTNNAFTVTNLDTRGATVEVTEPSYNCNWGTSGSVWYKFTPTVTGIYSIDTHGSNYQHSISIFKNDTAKTHLSCYDTDADPSQGENDPNGTPIAYQFTANQSYLIGFSDRNGGGNLTFTLKKETCPAGALCVSGTGNYHWAEAYTEVHVLDQNNNEIASAGGDGKGYTIVPGVKAGKYTVITSAWGFYLVNQNVTIPGLLPIVADNSPRVEVDFRDTSGNLIEADEIRVAIDQYAHSYTHPYQDWDDQKFYIRMTPGTYAIQMSNGESKTVLAKTGVNVLANGTLDFDARNMETEQYTFHLDGVDQDVSYQQDMPGSDYWGNSVPVEDGDTVTVGMPEGFVFRPELGFGVDDWWYAFSLEKHTFTGDSDLSATLGGSLTPEIEFIDPPYRPGDESGVAWIKAKDEHDFFLVYAGHPVDGNWQNQIAYYEVIDTIPEPDVKITDSSGADLPELFAKYEFGTEGAINWKVKGTLDVGPYYDQGEITAEGLVPVYTADPNANDEIGNAEVIAGLPYSLEGYSITGSTTAVNDPTLDECGVGQGMASVWYQYTPDQSGYVLFDTRGSDFDTSLGIWKGTPGHLELVGCNDDLSLEPTHDQDSEVEVAVRAGETYYIEAMEYAPAMGMSSQSVKPISAQQLGGSLNLHITQGNYCYELATGLNLPAGGTITVSPPPDCLGDLYEDGTVITSLKVTPKSGYTFKYWQIGAGPDTTTDNPITGIIMDQDRGFKAQLLIKPGLPTLVSPANGALIPDLAPVLDWSDTVPAADHYTLQLATDKNFVYLNEFSEIVGSSYPVNIGLGANTTYYWRVKAYGLDGGAESLWTAYRTFRTKLGIPVLVTPAADSSVPTTRPTFQWNAVSGTNSYTLQISKNPNFATPVLTYTVTGTSYTPPVDLTPTNTLLYWRVKANGTNAGDYSLVRKFTSANPPGIPVLTVPLNTALVDSTDVPELQWNPSGVVAAVDHYDLQLSSNNTFTDLVVDTIDGDTAYKPAPLAPNSTYYWRVRSVAADGDYSLWSGVRNFRTKMLAPVLSAPADASNAETTRPTFSWSAVPGATGYNLMLSLNPTFIAPVQTIKVIGTSYTPTSDLPLRDQVYYWKVMANGLNPSNYSGSFSFRSANPPLIPSLGSPADKALVDGQAMPLFSWTNYTSDTSALTDHNDIQIATNASFTALVVDTTSDVTYYQPGILPANNTYYWRVRSVAAVGEGGVSDKSLWSIVRTFRTRMLAPVLTSPVAGINTHTNRPTFQWQAVAGATSYTLLVADNIGLTTNLKTFSTSYTSYIPTVDLTRSRTLYWAVRANGVNPSLNSVVESFVTGNPPAIPVLTLPANGAVLTDTTPKLDWKAGTGSPAAATDYEIEIASDATFTSDEAKYMVGSILPTYTVQIDNALTPGKYWFWRVRSYNGTDFSGWSAARSFKESIAAPVLRTPANLEEINNYTPTMDWIPVIGGVTYTLQVSRNNTFTSLVKNLTQVGSTYTFDTDLLPNQTYYWRVKANGAAFASAWSTVYRFNTGTE